MGWQVEIALGIVFAVAVLFVILKIGRGTFPKM
jgi:hypothetical protein